MLRTEGKQVFDELRRFFDVEIAGLDAKLHDSAPIETRYYAAIVVERRSSQAHFFGEFVNQDAFHIVLMPLASDVFDLLGNVADHGMIFFFLNAGFGRLFDPDRVTFRRIPYRSNSTLTSRFMCKDEIELHAAPTHFSQRPYRFNCRAVTPSARILDPG